MSASYALGAIGGLITLVTVFEMLRRRHLREKYAVWWVMVAIGTLAIAAFPGLLFWVAGLLNVKVPANLLFFVASMVLLVVSVQQSHDLGVLDERTRTLTEELALLRLELESRHDADSRQDADDS